MNFTMSMHRTAHDTEILTRLLVLFSRRSVRGPACPCYGL